MGGQDPNFKPDGRTISILFMLRWGCLTRKVALKRDNLRISNICTVSTRDLFSPFVFGILFSIHRYHFYIVPLAPQSTPPLGSFKNKFKTEHSHAC